ncbi:MAG: band 7 protein [Planctomycetes bacterium]|nr:band 7 protein [Planctomycetota bacterium]
MSALSRGQRILISLGICAVLFVAVGWQLFQWTICYWYVDEGNSLLLTYKGPPLPIPGMDLPAAPEGQLAEVDESGRPKQKGILAEMVGPGRHFYNPFFWECQKVPDVVIETKTVAIVTSRFGKDLPKGQFLVDGEIGKTEFRGTLRKVLGPGRYRINPKAFDVSIVTGEEVERSNGMEKRSGWVEIAPGYVGVVTNLTDNPITKVKPGIQSNVLQPGNYPTNKREQQIDVVSIGYLEKSVEATMVLTSDGHFKTDSSGEPMVAEDDSGIEFPSDDGFTIRMDFTAIWGLMPDQAPEAIRNFGNISAVENKAVMPAIENICRMKGSKLKAAELLDGETRQGLQSEVSQSFAEILKTKGISVQNGLVRNIYIPQDVRQPIQQGYIADELKITREQEQITAMTEGALREAEEKVKVQTETINVETQKMVAGKIAEGQKTAAETKAKTTKLVATIARDTAEIEKEATITLGAAKANALTLEEEAKAEKFKFAVEAFGSGQAYNQWAFAKGLPDNIELNLIYSGQGTFWTDLKGFSETMLGKQVKEQSPSSPTTPSKK